MPYLPSATTPAAIVPPDEEYVEPVAPVAATEEEAVYGTATPVPTQQAAPPATEEEAIYGGGATAPPPDNTRLGGVIDPVMAQLPEPARNLADIVGQPVGGALDVAGNVGGELLHGDIPGAAEAAFQIPASPQARMREQAGTRVGEGQSIDPTGAPLTNPGDLLSILPSLIYNTGLASAGGNTIDEWARANPQAVQDAYAAGGGNAVIDAYKASLDITSIPPPQLVNPLDAGRIDAGPIDRALAIHGDIDDFLGGYVSSVREGTLVPFLKDQLLETATDPLLFVPSAIGAKVLSTTKAGVRRIPGVERALTLTPQAQRAITGERIATGAEEIVAARAIARAADPGAVPAATFTPGAIPPPSPNGRQPFPADPGQAVAAAPPIPPPRTPRRAARTTTPDPERPASARTIPPARVTPGRAAPAQALPSRVALGLRRSRWVDAEGKQVVESLGNGQARIRPDFEPVMRRAYDDMKDASADEFWEPYPARHLDVNVDVGDEGLYARYRGAMTQGRYMLDDWGTTHATRRLPPEAVTNGAIDWPAVERLAAGGDAVDARAAQRAVAGKRAVDLYAHRIATAPDPDVEVEHLLLNYHLDQVSGRFDRPQYRDTSYWADRAEMMGEAIRASGYMPTPETLAAWRSLNLADAVREAYPDLADAAAARRLEGRTLVNAETSDLVVHTPGTERFGPREVPLRPLAESELRASEIITPETRPALEAALRERLDQYGLTDVALRLVSQLSDAVPGAPDAARGMYRAKSRSIVLALREADELPLSQAERVGLALDHEVVHALKDLGLFKGGEWSTLVGSARDHGIEDVMDPRYREMPSVDTARYEGELVAHLYEAWRIGKITLNRGTTSILEKVLAFFRGLGLALKDTYPESILRAIEAGDVGRRPRSITPATEAAAASLRTTTPEAPQGLLFDPSVPPLMQPARVNGVVAPETPPLERRQDVVSVPTESILTDPARFQPRQQLRRSHVEQIAREYDPRRFDPLMVWRDPQDRRLYVLAGHHRLEVMRQRGEPVTPARIIEGMPEADAIRFARTSNTQLGETTIERSNTVRREFDRLAGVNADALSANDTAALLAKASLPGITVAERTKLLNFSRLPQLLKDEYGVNPDASPSLFEAMAKMGSRISEQGGPRGTLLTVTRAEAESLYRAVQRTQRLADGTLPALSARAINDKVVDGIDAMTGMNRQDQMGLFAGMATDDGRAAAFITAQAEMLKQHKALTAVEKRYAGALTQAQNDLAALQARGAMPQQVAAKQHTIAALQRETREARRNLTDAQGAATLAVRSGELLSPPQFALRRRRVERRQAAQAAYAAAAPPVREALAAIDDPFFTRYGVAASEQTVRDLAQSADGLFRFPDGHRPEAGLTVDDVFSATLRDVEFWADLESSSAKAGGWSDAKSARMNRRWQELDKRFNPDGDIDRSLLHGADRQTARDEFALRAFRDAEERARPKNAPTSRIGAINEAYMGMVRTLMLFNYLNIARYTMQNVTTNSINLAARIGPKAVIDLFTSPADAVRVFRSNKALGNKQIFTTRWGSIEQQIDMGSKPNVANSHVKYLAARGSAGKLSKGLDVLSRVFAPHTLRYVGNVADQLFREKAAEAVVMREFRKFNRELVPMVNERMAGRGQFAATPMIPDAKVRQVVHDFLSENRHLIDANSGDPYRTMSGRAAKTEPMWNPEAFGQYLKRRLREDMRHPPDPETFNRAIDRITRDSKNRVRSILDEAEAKTDEAFFSWRDTNADAMARKFFLYHYWSSRQGGFYLEEAVKRPWILSSYGRMMEEFEAQAEEFEQPNWMKGFFQVQNSIAGFSTWFSPFDLAHSLLTFADWQYGEDYAEYKDVTALGKAGGMAPFLIHPLLQMVAYSLGLLGPDYYAPPVTGAETFGAKSIELLNLANAQGKLPDWVPGARDEHGNPVPLNVRPLQELYARVGNAISTALEPITGLSPVEVANMAGSQQRNIASIAEQEYRKAHPEANQMDVNSAVTSILADPGSPEFQAAFRKSADMPFHLTQGLPGIVQGAARLASPVRIYTWPEQYDTDRWNITPSGYTPPRNVPHLGEVDPATGKLTPAGERAKFVQAAARYGAATTPEGRALANMQNEYYALEPLDYAEAKGVTGKLYDVFDGESEESFTIGGVEYTPEMLRSLERGDLYHLGTQALADAGYSREQQTRIEDAQARYLADNPELAAYQEYKSLVQNYEGGPQKFVQDTVLVNPGFRQFVRSSLMDHTTGEIAYDDAQYVDAYLASQGRRPSVYSPLVGNEPSTIPGGYPALAGAPSGQPLLPQMTATEPFPLYSKPVDPDSYFANESLIAWIDPQLAGQMQTVSGPDPRYGMVQVQVGDTVGFVDAAYVQNASPPQPTAMPGRAPAPVQPTGGLAGLAGGVTNTLGAGKDALVGAVQGALGGSAGPGMTPAPPVETTATTPPGPFTIDKLTYTGTPNRSDRSAPPEGIVYHYTAGSSIDEFIADFMGQTGRDASSNYIVDKDGTIYELIDPDQAAWTHGDTNAPRTDLPWLTAQIAAGYNMNDRAVGIEIVNEGNRDGDFVPYTPEQIAAVTWLTQYLVDRYGITPSRDRLLGHSDINSTSKFDPGPLFPLDEIIAAAT